MCSVPRSGSAPWARWGSSASKPWVASRLRPRGCAAPRHACSLHQHQHQAPAPAPPSHAKTAFSADAAERAHFACDTQLPSSSVFVGTAVLGSGSPPPSRGSCTCIHWQPSPARCRKLRKRHRIADARCATYLPARTTSSFACKHAGSPVNYNAVLFRSVFVLKSVNPNPSIVATA